MTKRHVFIPDLQVRPGVALDHIAWVAQSLVEYRPDAIIIAGDVFDMPSLNSHEDPGSAFSEGQRYQADIESGNEALANLVAPMRAEQARIARNKQKAWTPREVFLDGNHEARVTTFVASNPKFRNIVCLEDMEVQGFERHSFGEIVEVQGILYSHYFSNPHSGRAIGGTPQNRLNKIGQSFMQGHLQGFEYGCILRPTGKTIHGVVAGSCYLHRESYRGVHQRHWRGIIIANEVEDGEFCVMPLTLDHLCRKYEGAPLHKFMKGKHPDHSWEHLR